MVDLNDVHQSYCNKPDVSLTNGGNRGWMETEFIVCSSCFQQPPLRWSRKQHLLKHLSYKVLPTYTHFPSAAITIQFRHRDPGTTCREEDKTTQLFHDLPSSWEKTCVVQPESNTLKVTLSTWRVSFLQVLLEPSEDPPGQSTARASVRSHERGAVTSA